MIILDLLPFILSFTETNNNEPKVKMRFISSPPKEKARLEAVCMV